MSAAIAESPDLLRPVAPSERVELIDILRGFALLGILVVNFSPWGDAVTQMDRVVSATLDIAAANSFYPLFSFLFGLGFAIQLLRARERGAGVVNLYLRRMLALFLIGSFHAVVIWNGDIVRLYAVLGLFLIPLHRLRERWLWATVAVILTLGLWAPQVRAFTGRLGGADAEATVLREWESGQRANSLSVIAERYEAEPTATRVEAFGVGLSMRWMEHENRVRGIVLRNFLLSDVLALFVLGLIVGRRRILQEASRHRRSLAIAAAAGLMASAAGTLVVHVGDLNSGLLEGLARYASNYGATVFYVAGIALAVTVWSRMAAIFRPFAAAGRLGLTNYIMQSLVMTLFFVRYGMGLEQPSTTVSLLIHLTFFFAIQIPFSRWWIARYRFGPAEWLWRTMTYGKRQPMRLPSRVPTTPSPQPALVG